MSFQTSEADLRDAFGQFGKVTDLYIADDGMRPRGFAFVTFSTEDESKTAAENMNSTDLGRRPLTVNEPKPKEEMSVSRPFSSPDRRDGAFEASSNRRY